MHKWILFSTAILAFLACRKNSDVTTIEETPIDINEHFDFTLNGNNFSTNNLSAWIENHDTVMVTQLVNFGTGELPQFIFNIHGTQKGSFHMADMTITLDEEEYTPHLFKCAGCAFIAELEYFGEKEDFIVGSFAGQVPSDGTWYEISGSFAAIRKN